MSKFCVEVLTKDFGLAREAIFIVDRDHLAEQVADVVAISPHVACTVSRAPAEALITPEWPSFLAGPHRAPARAADRPAQPRARTIQTASAGRSAALPRWLRRLVGSSSRFQAATR